MAFLKHNRDNNFYSEYEFYDPFKKTVNFSGSNTDGSFTTAILYSSLSPLEKIQKLQIWDDLN